MNKQKDLKNAPGPEKDEERNDDLPGYPKYPAREDIYNQYKEEKDADPEEIFRRKLSLEDAGPGTNNELGFKNDLSGSDLDIPGSELDDAQEDIGSEDEENNFYSLGGDGNN
jgi:hypothetical protein